MSQNVLAICMTTSSPYECLAALLSLCTGHSVPPSQKFKRLSIRTVTMSSSADDDPSFKTPLEDVEPLECYRPRGYHPSLVADKLSERKKTMPKGLKAGFRYLEDFAHLSCK